MTLELERAVAEPDQLTRREREIVALLMHGTITSVSLAAALCIGETTLHYHLNNIMRKLDVASRAEVVSFAWQHGAAIDGLWVPAQGQENR